LYNETCEHLFVFREDEGSCRPHMPETLTVAGVDCPHCASQIKQSLGAITGVLSVEVDLANKVARIAYDPAAVTRDLLAAAVEDAGFDVAP
jgi:copper chaperone CopZ